MKVATKWINLVAASLFVLSGCDAGPDARDTEFGFAVQAAVERLAEIQAGAELDGDLSVENPVRTDDQFDAAAYFQALDHLSMEEGYVLDWVYRYCWGGASPVLYARKASARRFATYEDWETATEDAATRAELDFARHVRVDGTPEGFAQLVLLQLLGEQFLLGWHGHLDDAMVVATTAALELAIREMERAGSPVDPDLRLAARFLDLAPWVEMTEDAALVSLLTFTKWGGFHRLTYTVSRGFPHVELAKCEKDLVLAYDCGWTP